MICYLSRPNILDLGRRKARWKAEAYLGAAPRVCTNETSARRSRVPTVVPGYVPSPGEQSYPVGETATTNNTHINDINTDRHVGNGEQRLPETGGNDRRGVVVMDRDGLGADGHQEGRKKKRRTRGRTKFASLNMRGYGSAGAPTANEKWMRINQLIRDQKIAVLCLQETHLTNERIGNLNDLFSTTMKVIGSPDPENETGARGVAFAINKRIVMTDELSVTTIIPGRAICLNFKWTNDSAINIMNVYAPNNMTENEHFWREIEENVRERRTRRPDIVMGDFNVVEESMDRLPPRGDREGAVEALQRMVNDFGISDGWRRNNAREKAFTYMQTATGSQSRIDRIYATEDMIKCAEDWEITGPGIHTDHRLISVSLANYRKPGLGKGRWAFPNVLLNDGEFTKTMKELGRELQRNIEELRQRNQEKNPQTIYLKFKADLKDAARKRAKALIPKLDRKIEAMKDDVRELLEAENPDKHRVAILQDKITRLEIKRFDRKRRAVATKDWLQGEAMTKYCKSTSSRLH